MIDGHDVCVDDGVEAFTSGCRRADFGRGGHLQPYHGAVPFMVTSAGAAQAHSLHAEMPLLPASPADVAPRPIGYWDATQGYPGEGPGLDDEDDWIFADEGELRAEEVADLENEHAYFCEQEPQVSEAADDAVAQKDGLQITDEALAAAGISHADLEGDVPRGEVDAAKSHIEIINAGSWTGARARLLQLGPDVQIVAVQEHRLAGERLAEADRWLASRGWQAVWSAAQPLPSGRLSGGVAVLARATFGIAEPLGDVAAEPLYQASSLIEVQIQEHRAVVPRVHSRPAMHAVVMRIMVRCIMLVGKEQAWV